MRPDLMIGNANESPIISLLPFISIWKQFPLKAFIQLRVEAN